jgi:hypothetical protein
VPAAHEPALPTFLAVAERCGGWSGPRVSATKLVGATTNDPSADFDHGDDDERLQIGAPVG